MTVFQLNEDDITFPPPGLACENGLLAIGGDLRPERLIAAYRTGIFPWFSQGDPLLWWFVDPRLVLFPDEFRVGHRLARHVRSGQFQVSFDRAFPQVIASCASVRIDRGEGTWISGEMQDAYTRLHELGYAHSVECWQDNVLVGGLYGIAMGRVFFGESMFSRVSNASKVALVSLMARLRRTGFQLVDCQMTTRHLLSFGAREIAGVEFLDCLQQYIQTSDSDGMWHDE